MEDRTQAVETASQHPFSLGLVPCSGLSLATPTWPPGLTPPLPEPHQPDFSVLNDSLSSHKRCPDTYGAGTHLVNLFSPVGACLHLPKHSSSLPGVLGRGWDPDALFTYDHLPLHLPDPGTHISLTGLWSFLAARIKRAICAPNTVWPLPGAALSPYSLPYLLYSRHMGLSAAWLFQEHTGHAPASEPLQPLILML